MSDKQDAVAVLRSALNVPAYSRIGQFIANRLRDRGWSNEEMHQVLFYISDADLVPIKQFTAPAEVPAHGPFVYTERKLREHAAPRISAEAIAEMRQWRRTKVYDAIARAVTEDLIDYMEQWAQQPAPAADAEPNDAELLNAATRRMQDAMREEAEAQAGPKMPFCPVCGYTKKDSAMWLDHHLCKGKIPDGGSR
jgi:hypothetical protein